MNIATLLVALIATSAADTTGDPVLLDFQAVWCGPCQQMAPEVEKLVSKGYPVKKVDINQSPKLSERYNVEAVPTFIVVDAKGKELARTQGAMPASQLAAFYNEAKLKAAANGLEPRRRRRRSGRTRRRSRADRQPEIRSIVNPKPWETVVRIKMHLSDS